VTCSIIVLARQPVLSAPRVYLNFLVRQREECFFPPPTWVPALLSQESCRTLPVLSRSSARSFVESLTPRIVHPVLRERPPQAARADRLALSLFPFLLPWWCAYCFCCDESLFRRLRVFLAFVLSRDVRITQDMYSQCCATAAASPQNPLSDGLFHYRPRVASEAHPLFPSGLFV